jgi:hypothetical protein
MMVLAVQERTWRNLVIPAPKNVRGKAQVDLHQSILTRRVIF